MSEWKEYNLNEVYDFASGLSKGAAEFGFGHGFLGFKDVFHNFFAPDELTSLVNSTEKEQESCSIKRGDVFLTRTSETDEDLGMSCVALKDYPKATFNGFTKRLRPKGNVEILPEYAGFYFRSPRFRASVSGMSSITTRASLNNSMLADLKIPIPSINEQKAISETLMALHKKIELLERQNNTLEKLGGTLFRQWFVDEARTDWEIKQLDEFFPVMTGKRDANFATENGKYPFFTCSQKSFKCDSYSFDGHSILLAGNGDFSVKRYKGKFDAYQRTYVLIPKDEKYVGFLFYLMQYFLNDITMGAQGSVISFLTKGMITDYKFPFPKNDYDEKLIKINSLNDKIDANGHQIENLTMLRNSILPKIFNKQIFINYE